MGPEPGSRTALPELKPGGNPEEGNWYALLPPGDSPCARVGQNSLYLPPAEPGGRKGKVILVGGADPSGSFADSYVMDLDAHCWTAPAWRGLLPRYEHASFIPTSCPTSLWVFGGASETGNRNCVQVLDLHAGTWMSPKVTGTPPSPRTYHTSSAVIGDRLYVFGGGDKGVDPVKDQQLHIFDSATLTWLQPEVQGNPPAPRHGHAVVAVENRLYIHGGLAGDTFFDDLFCFDTTEMKWETLSATGSVPAGRAAHSAAVFKGHLYIFGGMDPTGALDTMYKYHIEMGHWTKLEFKTPVPSARLDQSMCVVPWKVSSNEESNRKEGAGGSNGDHLSQGCPDEHLCLVFGGMDIKGEIYKDSAVTLLK